MDKKIFIFVFLLTELLIIPAFGGYLQTQKISSDYNISNESGSFFLDAPCYERANYSRNMEMEVFFFSFNNMNAIYRRKIDFYERFHVPDYIEPFNRTMAGVNYVMLLYVYRPIGTVYATIFPRFLIEGFSNITGNVEFLVRFGSLILQGRFSDSGEEFLRFLANTTLGIGGFFDVADPWFGLKAHDEDFGQAFASWGIGSGTYIMLPVQGPCNLRDGMGLIFDYGLDPKTYIYGAQWFTKVNNAALYYQEIERVIDSRIDTYIYVRDIYYIVRKVKIGS